MYRTFHKQKGYAILLAAFMISLMAIIWIGSKEGNIVTALKTHAIEDDFYDLRLVKSRLLEYSVLIPEIYHGVNTEVIASQPISKSPEYLAPGYLPCPDFDGDGVSEWAACSTGSSVATVRGFLPWKVQQITDGTYSSDSFYFTQKITPVSGQPDLRYLYYVDTRFMLPNGDLSSKLYWPLTPLVIQDSSFSLSLNGAQDYIALIIDPGLDGTVKEVIDEDTGLPATATTTHFRYVVSDKVSSDPNIDKIIGISFQEDWIPLIARRICGEKKRYVTGSETEAELTTLIDSPHWFFGGGDGRVWYRWGDALCP